MFEIEERAVGKIQRHWRQRAWSDSFIGASTYNRQGAERTAEAGLASYVEVATRPLGLEELEVQNERQLAQAGALGADVKGVWTTSFVAACPQTSTGQRWWRRGRRSSGDGPTTSR